jgi:lysophospholipase L1-like esterase
VNLACSGAHTQDVTNPYNRQPAQTAALAALRPRPKIVTITIGGNDAGFGTVLGLCAATPAAGPQDCTQAVAAAEAFMVTQLPDRLADTYRAVEAADPRARLVVVGYPRLVPATDAQVTSCSWLSSNERQALNQAADLLNLVIRIEAYLAHATYVDVNRAVRGHELCTADPWIVPIGSTTAPRSSWAHPNPQGQQAIASRVLDVLEK